MKKLVLFAGILVAVSFASCNSSKKEAPATDAPAVEESCGKCEGETECCKADSCCDKCEADSACCKADSCCGKCENDSACCKD